MKPKKLTSWGVSFASLALVAGMMSYMGMTNKDKTSQTNTVAQAQTTTTSQRVNNQNSSISYELPNQTTNNDAAQSSTDQSISGQHGSFDTTTGGT